jgi:hypothetical protein
MLVPKMPAPTILLKPILALPALIDANQIPVHRGIVGGVAFPDTINATSAQDARKNVFAVGAAPTSIPGQLRVVENSGIYDTCILSRVPCCVVKFCRNYHRCLSGFWIWHLSQNESIWCVLDLRDPLFHVLSTSRR